MMITAYPSSRALGVRIGNYRNSIPRVVKLVGLSAGCGPLVAAALERGRDNVVAHQPGQDSVVLALDAPVGMLKPDAVIAIHFAGEPLSLEFLPSPTVPMLSLVVIDPAGVTALTDRRLHELRGQADLFVTTSDAGLLTDLVDNLSS